MGDFVGRKVKNGRFLDVNWQKPEKSHIFSDPEVKTGCFLPLRAPPLAKTPASDSQQAPPLSPRTATPAECLAEVLRVPSALLG